MRARRLGALGLATSLLLIACGDTAPDQVDASPDEVRVALVNGLLAEANADPNAVQLAREDAECVADGVIAELGTDRLATVGYGGSAELPTSLNAVLEPEERLTVAIRLGECIDLVAEIETALLESGAPASRARCVAERYVESGLLTESLAAAEFDADLNRRIDSFLAQAMMECR